MFNFRHRTLIIISGLIWLAVGLFLLPLGLRLVMESAQMHSVVSIGHYPLMQFIVNFFEHLYN